MNESCRLFCRWSLLTVWQDDLWGNAVFLKEANSVSVELKKKVLLAPICQSAYYRWDNIIGRHVITVMCEWNLASTVLHKTSQLVKCEVHQLFTVLKVTGLSYSVVRAPAGMWAFYLLNREQTLPKFLLSKNVPLDSVILYTEDGE